MESEDRLSAKPIFVVGVGRSGTTLIRLMLNSHPNIAIPYESHFITKYCEKLSDFGDLSESSNIAKLAESILAESLLRQWDHAFDLERVLERVSEPTLSDVIGAIYTEYARANNASRWGDKSDYLGKMFVINRLFPDAQFIHCVRDGRDVARSVLKLPWGPSDLIQAAEWWTESVRLGRSMGQMLPEERYLEVRYEDLVTEPAAELHRICAFLDEGYSDSMLEYYKAADTLIPTSRKGQHHNVGSPPDPTRVYAWKKAMSPADVVLFEKYASSELAHYGYETGHEAAGALRLEMRRGRIFAGRFWRSLLG